MLGLGSDDFERPRQRYLVVAIQSVDDHEFLVGLLVKIGIKPGQFKAEYPGKLFLGKCRVRHRAQHIEKSLDAQLPPHRGDVLHGRMKQRCVQKANARFGNRPFEVVLFVAELYAEVFQHGRRAAGRGHAVVAMLGDALPRPRDYEARERGNIKRILAVAARTANIHGVIICQIHRQAKFQHGVAEAFQLGHRHAAHGVNGQESRDLGSIVVALGDAHQDFFGLLFAEGFVFE